MIILLYYNIPQNPILIIKAPILHSSPRVFLQKRTESQRSTTKPQTPTKHRPGDLQSSSKKLVMPSFPSALKGPWDFATKVMNKVTICIVSYKSSYNLS